MLNLQIPVLSFGSGFRQTCLDVTHENARGPCVLPEQSGWRGQFSTLNSTLHAGLMAIEHPRDTFLRDDGAWAQRTKNGDDAGKLDLRFCVIALDCRRARLAVFIY